MDNIELRKYENNMTEKQMDWYMSIGTSEYATQTFFDGADGVIEASGRDSRKLNAFNFMAQANLRMWENEWYQYKKGLYEEDEFLARSAIWPGVVAQPGYKELWELQEANFAPEFKEYINSFFRTQN